MTFKQYYEKQWILDGLSAKCIYGVHIKRKQELNYPHDPDDLTRCFQCLRFLTDSEDKNVWKIAIAKVVGAYPESREWDDILNNFDELYDSYFQEYDSKSMPITYNLMSRILDRS